MHQDYGCREEDEPFLLAASLILQCEPMLYQSDEDCDREPRAKEQRIELDVEGGYKKAKLSEIEPLVYIKEANEILCQRAPDVEGTDGICSNETLTGEGACTERQWEEAMVEAVRKGDMEGARYAGIRGGERWTDRKDKISLLHVAVLESDTAMLRLLLELRCSPDATTVSLTNKTALHIAAEAGIVDAVEMLVRYRAGLDTKDVTGRTPLEYALLAGDSAVVTALLDCGADQDKCLHKIICSCSETMLSEVLTRTKTWLYLDGEDENGLTPLMHASKHDNGPSLIRVLVAAGAHVNRYSLMNEETALHVACKNAMARNISELIVVGAAVDVKNAQGETPYELVHRMHGAQSECARYVAASSVK